MLLWGKGGGSLPRSWSQALPRRSPRLYRSRKVGVTMTMRSVERTVRAELRALGVSPQTSSLARNAVVLARRLDDNPADSIVVLLARELRMTMTNLHEQSGGGGPDEVERFLARIATPDLGHAAD